MKKLKIAIIFGGESTEHEVSIVSGTSVIEHINKEKYEIYPVYIDKSGNWYEYKKEIDKIKTLEIKDNIEPKEKIEDIVGYLKNIDVAFPVLHGAKGEDGAIQGLFELSEIPYVGCKVLASSIGMDKAYTKIIFEKAGIKQTNYEYIRKYKNNYIHIDKNFNETTCTLDEIVNKIEKNIKYPMFIKPSNSGSSVGINKAKTKEELKEYIEIAGQFDYKILIEEGIQGKEIECAVLGNEQVEASCVGEIKPADEFYSYSAKYSNAESKTIIPANIDETIVRKIQEIAIKAFKAIDGKGLSRVDFFVEEKTNEIYINEINTIPGFTQISMYPKLFEQSGISYTNLIDKLIELAME